MRTLLIILILCLGNACFAQKDSVFAQVEREARFAGGDSAYKSWLLQGIQAVADSAKAKKVAVGQYKIVVIFIVEKDGSLSILRVDSTPSQAIIESLVTNLILSSPKWLPALQNDRPVKAYRKQPLTFEITYD